MNTNTNNPEQGGEKKVLCSPEQLRAGWFPIECEACGWKGCSCELDGGGQIADTGDYGDSYCPKCGEVNDCDEISNEQPNDPEAEEQPSEQCEGCKGDDGETVQDKAQPEGWHIMQALIRCALINSSEATKHQVNRLKKFFSDKGFLKQADAIDAMLNPENCTEVGKLVQSSLTFKSALVNKEKKQGDCLECGEDLEHPFATGYHKDKVRERENLEATIKQLQNRIAELEKEKNKGSSYFDVEGF